MAIALAWLAVWEVPETCLAFITTTAKCIISTVALAIFLTTEGIKGPLVVAVTSWKTLDIIPKLFNYILFHSRLHPSELNPYVPGAQ